MIKYEWPGNIRELENVLERMAVMSEHDTLDYSDLPEDIQLSNSISEDFKSGKSLKELWKHI